MLVIGYRSSGQRAARRVPRRAAGFTLTELLVTIAIMGVLAALAAPSFTDMVARQRLRTGAFDLVADLLLARSEAIKRNETVTVAAAGATWAAGWTVQAASGDQISRRAAFGSGITTTAGATSIPFNRDGRVAGTVAVTLNSTLSSASDAPRCVQVQPSGRATARKGTC